MLLAWDNLADEAASLSADSEVPSLPASNAQQSHVAQAWHTAAGVKGAYLLLDLGSALACSVLALLGTNFTGAATVRVRASTLDPNAIANLLLDTGVVAAGAKAGYGGVYKAFTETTARYWRIDIADATVPDNLQVGRLFLGPSWTPSSKQLYDWSVTPNDESRVAKSYGGQAFPDERPQTRILSFVLDYMNEAEMYGNAFALARSQGVVRDVLAIPEIAGAYVSEQAVWGLCRGSEPLINRRALIYRQKFTIEERL